MAEKCWQRRASNTLKRLSTCWTRRGSDVLATHSTPTHVHSYCHILTLNTSIPHIPCAHSLILSHPHTSSPDSPKPLDVLFGKCQFYYQRHNFSHALEQANLAVASYPGFLPALVEKTRVLLALQDWEQAVETAHRYGLMYPS